MSTRGSGPTSDVVVQKYGGSSLATVSQVRQVADRVGALARSGRGVVVVVSAPGDTTDELIGRAGAVNPHPAGHELDQLLATGETTSAALMAMALQHSGLAATALSGSRSGILATGPHGAGVIVAIDTEQLRTLLDAGQVVVIAGFQGVTADGDIITLRTHDTPDPSPDVFRFLAEESVPADMTTVASAPDGGFSLGLTVHRSHAADVSRSFSDLMARSTDGPERPLRQESATPTAPPTSRQGNSTHHNSPG
ncbi:amino acid kinase family protein [Streptomyces cyaneofuscatus]|uniref:amino acid kinase family protein n=1 Tax=Streptomyces cyaneofuscatus TaxID=66883 RepID=UPI0033BC7782